MNLKYALLLFNYRHPFPNIHSSYKLDQNLEVFSGSIESFVGKEEVKSWKESIGSLAWDQLFDNGAIIVGTSESADPNLLNSKNQELCLRVNDSFRLLPILGPFCPPFEQGFLVSGSGTMVSGKLKIKDIRSFSRYDFWRRSYYHEHHTSVYSAWANAELSQAVRNY